MIDIKMEFPKLDKVLKDHQDDILLVLAAAMQTNRAMMFDKEGADNGKDKWAPLKWRRGRILQNRGTLRKSWGPPNDGKTPGRSMGSVVRSQGNAVIIGTNLAYAKLMNDGTTKMPGGVLRPVNAQALKIPVPPGFHDQAYKKKINEVVKQLRKDRKKIIKSGSASQLKDNIDKIAGMKAKKNQGFIFRKSVKIAARPMDTVTDLDEQEYVETVANYISELLSRG